MSKLTGFEKVIAVVGTIAALGAGGALISYGELRQRVATLEKQVGDLKNPPSPKGDLCGILTEELALSIRIGDSSKIEEMRQQMDKMGCYNVSAVAATPVARPAD